jgi:hypothetical protein
MNISEAYVISIFQVKEYANQEANRKQVAGRKLQLNIVSAPAHKIKLQ